MSRETSRVKKAHMDREGDLATVKLTIIDNERQRKAAANRKILATKQADADRQMELDLARQNIIEKEKMRKSVIERKNAQIVRNIEERKAQLEIVKKIIVEKEKKRKEAAEMLVIAMEAIQEEIQVRKEVDRIMDLKDEKMIMEELCKLNKVNASKGVSRRSKSQKHMDGINKLIDDERKIHLEAVKNDVIGTENAENDIQGSFGTNDAVDQEHDQGTQEQGIEDSHRCAQLELVKKSIIEIERKRIEANAKVKEDQLKRLKTNADRNSVTFTAGTNRRMEDKKEDSGVVAKKD